MAYNKIYGAVFSAPFFVCIQIFINAYNIIENYFKEVFLCAE